MCNRNRNRTCDFARFGDVGELGNALIVRTRDGLAREQCAQAIAETLQTKNLLQLDNVMP